MDDEKAKALRERWSRDLINHIVIALNEDLPLDPLMNDIEIPRGLEPSPLRLDLRGIDFSHQNLRGPWQETGSGRRRHGVPLASADLAGADLSWALLPRADLRKASLKHANLQNTELIMADLREADLTGADLTGAWLLDTRFQEARVTPEQLQTRRRLGQLDFDYHAFEI